MAPHKLARNETDIDHMRVPHDQAPWLHIYAQSFEHDDATIRGNVEALIALRDALNDAIEKGQSSASVFALDGEGYRVKFQRVNVLGLIGPLPYTEEHFSAEREAFFASAKFISGES